MRRLGPVRAATLVVAAFFAISARADDEFAVLRSQLEQVKALVADMEARLAELQAKRCAAPPASPAANSPPVCSAPTAEGAAAPVAASVPQTAPPATAPANAAAATSVSPAPPPATPVGEVPRAAWGQVQEGLSEEDVRRLLGPPTRTFDLPGRKVWYYVYPEHRAGSVFFDTSGKVSSEQAPTRW